jgi:lysine-N-methylase
VAIRLPILSLNIREQRYSCHGCGNCCRDFTVQLRGDDLRRLGEQGWEARLGEPVTVDFRGTTYLRQREDGSCMFLLDDGRCRIHAEHGFEAKPVACQLFPFHLVPASGGLMMGISFACQSVLESKGAELKSHATDLGRMAGELAELRGMTSGTGGGGPPMLTGRLRASEREASALTGHVDRWLRRADVRLPVRLDGLAWVAQSLASARIEKVREDRFSDLLDVLFGALPAELAHHPVEAPSARQRRMLRQAVFARTEDPKISRVAQDGRWRTILGQLSRSRRFKRGRGPMPRVGIDWPVDVRGEAVEAVARAHEPTEAAAIDDLVTRWLRATVLGGRCWGAGYYGWPAVSGLQAMLLNAASAGWLARLHAAGRGLEAVDLIAARSAIGRIDRTAGRARWLGSRAEMLRLAYLGLSDGLRRLVAAYALVSPA